MRFDTLVTFHSEGKVYNADTGEYEVATDLLQTILANVVDTGTSKSIELFGDVDTKSKTICLSRENLFDWDYLTFKGSDTKYVRLTTRRPLHALTLIVGETHE